MILSHRQGSLWSREQQIHVVSLFKPIVYDTYKPCGVGYHGTCVWDCTWLERLLCHESCQPLLVLNICNDPTDSPGGAGANYCGFSISISFPFFFFFNWWKSLGDYISIFIRDSFCQWNILELLNTFACLFFPFPLVPTSEVNDKSAGSIKGGTGVIA